MLTDSSDDELAVVDTRPVEGDAASQRVAAVVLSALTAAQSAVHDAEQELGRMDAVAGDGDHGRGMVRGHRPRSGRGFRCGRSRLGRAWRARGRR